MLAENQFLQDGGTQFLPRLRTIRHQIELINNKPSN